jgi:phosphoribosylamine--glycine ligase
LGNTGQALVYHAGTKMENRRYYTNGGRVLGLTALAPTLQEAVLSAYAAVERIDFRHKQYRRDIGRQALSV